MHRKKFLSILSFLPLLANAKGLTSLLNTSFDFRDSPKMPVFFVGHGSPENAYLTNPFTESLRKMGEALPQRPSAILVVSAHWLSVEQTYITTRTQFYESDYPVVGAPALAHSLIQANPNIIADEARDLDHGAWAILRHIAPKADIPILELSIDMAKPLDEHWRISQQLKALRRKGVLIIGSGNIVHNLDLSMLKVFSRKPYDWAIEFDEWVKARINDRDFVSLLYYDRLGKMAKKSVPTMDHYIPMLYSLALTEKNEPITFTYEEVFAGLSMRCFRIG